MCNEFQRHKLLTAAIEEFDRRSLPLFKWHDGLIPNLDAQPSIKIRDSAVIVRLVDGKVESDIRNAAPAGVAQGAH